MDPPGGFLRAAWEPSDEAQKSELEKQLQQTQEDLRKLQAYFFRREVRSGVGLMASNSLSKLHLSWPSLESLPSQAN